MQTIKTFVVIGLLLAVCYGAFVALNAPVVGIPEELQQWASSADNQSIDGFEIPSLEIPDNMFEDKSSSSISGPAQAQVTRDFSPIPQFPNIDSPNLPETGLPQFPAVDAPKSNALVNSDSSLPPLPQAGGTLLASPQVGNPQLSNPQTASAPLSTLQSSAQPALSSNTPAAGPSDQSSGTLGDPSVGLNNTAAAPSDTVASQASIPSGAKLTSSLPPSESAFGVTQPGPSIPFNPESSSSSTAVNDLISAADDDIQSLNNLQTSPGDSAAGQVESPSTTSTVAAQMASSSNKLLDTAQPRATLPFRQAREQALQFAQQGKLADALELMTQYYESPELGYAEHTDLVDLLDALSREVIYSGRHILSSAHTVTAQENLTSLAEQNRITPELLAAINQLGESPVLVPNSKLKVIEGPFRAQISLSRGELTLFLRKMYAGRFPVSVSQVNKPAIGNYEIVDRRQDRTFYGANTVIPAGAPNNPYGKYWLSLGGNLAIHGSPEQVTSDLEGAGCISLAPLDAADAFRILGKGAAVEVRP